MCNGRVLFEGSSLIDGSPIVVVATGLERGSSNSKTGAMVQTYILRRDMSPIEAIKSGADTAICGDCPHRGNGNGSGRTCYVNVGQGPLAVWKAWKRGSYPIADAGQLYDIGARRVVRLGTYGDPAAVPAYVWERLTRDCVAHTGYTHQWRKAPELRGLCMASADSEADALEARAAGWRTFRVALPCDVARMERESVCPASAEAGRKLTCEQCRACSGADGRRGSIVIQAHGGRAVMANVAKRVSSVC